MRASFCVACVYVAATGCECFGQAVIVQNENVRFQTLPGDRFELTVCPSVTCDAGPADGDWPNAPFALFNYSDNSIASEITSADGQYYETVNFGKVFNPLGAQAFIGWSSRLGDVGDDDFYLGIWIPIGDPFNPPPLQAYGWVHLAPVDGLLTMVGNVMSYSSPGIVVGTTTVVPEPTSLIMLSTGLAIVFAKRFFSRLID